MLEKIGKRKIVGYRFVTPLLKAYVSLNLVEQNDEIVEDLCDHQP